MLNQTSCCGLREFTGLEKTPELTLKTFYKNMVYGDPEQGLREEAQAYRQERARFRLLVPPPHYVPEPVVPLAQRYRPQRPLDGAYFIFTGTRTGVINKLAKYIKTHKLGIVHKTGFRRNPSSGNRLMVLLFEPNRRRIRKWYHKKVGKPRGREEVRLDYKFIKYVFRNMRHQDLSKTFFDIFLFFTFLSSVFIFGYTITMAIL